MKTVYSSNSEIPHLWAHQTQSEARASSISFRGATVYSYSTAMGRILKTGQAVLLNRARYSVSTSKHQRYVSRAVSHYPHRFEIYDAGRGECLANVTGKEIVNGYIGEAVKCLEMAQRSRADNRSWRTERAEEYLRKANETIAYFHLNRAPVLSSSKLVTRAVAKLSAELKAERADARQREKEAEARAVVRAAESAHQWIANPRDYTLREDDRNRLPAELLAQLTQAEMVYFSAQARTAAETFISTGEQMSYRLREYVPADLEEAVETKQVEIQAAAEARRRDDAIEQAQRFIAGGLTHFTSYEEEYLTPELLAAVNARRVALHGEQIEAWRNGAAGYVVGLSELPTMLRANGEQMETSKGARVALADAERSYRFASALRAKGWHRNGETHAIGPYQLDAVNEFGIVAGCHRVSWEEADRFATAQGWR